jgi:dihydrofolate reductase
VGKIVVSQFMTVDGVVEGPGDDPGFDRNRWAFQFDRGEDGNKFKLDELMASDVLLLGRVTYEGFAKAWPNRKDEFGFADKFNTMPKYVVSTTMKDPEWANSTVISENVPEEVSKLREQPGGDVLVNGSVQLVQTLVEHDLVDEYRFMVFPIVLGAGKRHFGETSEPKKMRLVDTKPVGPEGVIVLTYQPA